MEDGPSGFNTKDGKGSVSALRSILLTLTEMNELYSYFPVKTAADIICRGCWRILQNTGEVSYLDHGPAKVPKFWYQCDKSQLIRRVSAKRWFNNEVRQTELQAPEFIPLTYRSAVQTVGNTKSYNPSPRPRSPSLL
jgi:hypothetical protein